MSEHDDELDAYLYAVDRRIAIRDEELRREYGPATMALHYPRRSLWQRVRGDVATVLMIVGFFGVFTGFIFQQLASLELYCEPFARLIIPHWSAWLYLGVIPAGVGVWLTILDIRED